MDTTFDDLTNGTRIDIVVEFISARTHRCGDSTVARLLVGDSDGTRFEVLGAPEALTVQDLRVGDTYRVSGLVGATPPSLSGTDDDCPDCGGPLRPGDSVDVVGPAVAQTALQLDLGDRFGIIDSWTVFRRDRHEASLIDDCPFPVDSAFGRAPEYVCRSCERHVWKTDLGKMAVPGPGDGVAVVDSGLTDR